VTFEYLTPEEAAELTPVEAEWEEAALKREAAQGHDLAETIEMVTKTTERLEELVCELRGERKAERPDLRLVADEGQGVNA
jgi:hypothetical protein